MCSHPRTTCSADEIKHHPLYTRSDPSICGVLVASQEIKLTQPHFCISSNSTAPPRLHAWRNVIDDHNAKLKL